MVFIHRPGADDMTLDERLKHISLRGNIKIVVVTQRDKNTIPIAGLIAWNIDPNRLINKQKLHI
jgi:hypothetical protein